MNRFVSIIAVVFFISCNQLKPSNEETTLKVFFEKDSNNVEYVSRKMESYIEKDSIITMVFYENNNLHSIATAIKDTLINNYISFWQNGIPKIQGQYSSLLESKDSKCRNSLEKDLLYVKGCKKGVWLFWDEEGVLKKKEYWSFGVIDSVWLLNNSQDIIK